MCAAQGRCDSAGFVGQDITRSLLKIGITVGLGTDGSASNNDLDLFREMDFTAKLHKAVAKDPTTAKASTVLKMATLDGARAIGLGDVVGSLEPGKAADLIIVDINKPHLVPMNLHETIDQMLKLTHEQMAQKNISAECRKAAELDTIQGDSKLLSQAMINLTLNAIEAIEKDGTIRIETCNLDYRFASGDDPASPVTRKCIRIQITDTGKGIPQESIQKIFDPFFTNKSEGTGMGLSVAHGIISDHHGIIEVESEIGRGTTFYIYLPSLEEMAA